MREIVIIGAGIHRFGRFDDESYIQIGQEAARKALQDAGVAWKDIQSAYVSTQYLPSTVGPKILKPFGATGIPIMDMESACASGGSTLRQGMLSIASGAIDIALVLGVEKMPRGYMDPLQIYYPWQVDMGLSTNPSYWAMRARRHMHEYGTTEEHIAKIAFKNHKNSVHNPNAMYRKEFSMEQIQTSKLVCDPIRLLEICAPNEGAAAVVICAREAAQKYTSNPPITIAACVHTLAGYSADFRCPVDSLSAKVNNPGPTEVTSKKAYEMAGIGPQDVDCFEVQDTDAFCELEIYEQLGLCPFGEAGRLIDEGVTEIDGKHPVNMSGGLISKGEPVGASHLGQVYELVTQLRGNAGPRQVPNVRTALGQVLGASGNCAVTILKK
ncbi:MAG: thiolase family protein [Synergistaceae bacterium]|jgi:acetyl-CoA acetyltransferase|nr:thiolase family protein [Synergistaceae bacterium]